MIPGDLTWLFWRGFTEVLCRESAVRGAYFDISLCLLEICEVFLAQQSNQNVTIVYPAIFSYNLARQSSGFIKDDK